MSLGDKFFTPKVKTMRNMFWGTGGKSDKFILDLSNLSFDSVTEYTNFINTKTTTTIYVKSEVERNWILDKNFTGVNSNNVIVK